MSQQSASDFRNLVNSDPTIAAACLAAVSRSGELSMVKLGAQHGFEFTESEALAVMERAELSDLELELVAGGGGGCSNEKNRL